MNDFFLPDKQKALKKMLFTNTYGNKKYSSTKTKFCKPDITKEEKTIMLGS